MRTYYHVLITTTELLGGEKYSTVLIGKKGADKLWDGHFDHVRSESTQNLMEQRATTMGPASGPELMPEVDHAEMIRKALIGEPDMPRTALNGPVGQRFLEHVDRTEDF